MARARDLARPQVTPHLAVFLKRFFAGVSTQSSSAAGVSTESLLFRRRPIRSERSRRTSARARRRETRGKKTASVISNTVDSMYTRSAIARSCNTAADVRELRDRFVFSSRLLGDGTPRRREREKHSCSIYTYARVLSSPGRTDGRTSSRSVVRRVGGLVPAGDLLDDVAARLGGGGEVALHARAKVLALVPIQRGDDLRGRSDRG